jgi:glucose-6-phosphate 1-dehydrogenase
VTNVSVHFKPAPFMLFRETPVQCTNANVLDLRIQPDECISLSFDAKVPGPLERLDTVTMDFSYAGHFKTEPTTGYETLLFDAMAGDQTLFHRMDMVEAGWEIVDPVLKEWARRRDVPTYRPGSWGPADADLLMDQDGRPWRL